MNQPNGAKPGPYRNGEMHVVASPTASTSSPTTSHANSAKADIVQSVESNPRIEASPVNNANITPFGGQPAEVVKAQTANERAELTRHTRELNAAYENKRAELERKRDEMLREIERQRQELDATLAPLRKKMKQLEEVAWTVDLYLGRDEQITRVREGAPASADEPLTIRQRVLAMSEEAAYLTATGSTGFDYESTDSFIEWLRDDANLNQVLPEQKGLVVLVPTRVQVDSGNRFEDSYRNAQNAVSYWLIRNGQNVYLMTTDITVGSHLTPKRDEFVSYFSYTNHLGERIHYEPGSEAWVKAERNADARRRHFMRIFLVAQGLVDRTAVWHPLPNKHVNLLDVAEQANGRIVIINELDNILTDGRPTFRQWQRDLNEQLRPGHRVVGDWHSHEFNSLYESGDRYSRGGHPRVSPRTVVSRPAKGVPHVIDGRRSGMLVVKFDRTGETVWRRNVPIPDKPGYVYRGEYPVEAKGRASVLVDPTDSWVLPFDLATLDDLIYYRDSREARTDFLNMVPALQAAITAKEAEEEQETPFRELITNQLINDGVPTNTAPQKARDLIHWWKTANMYGRALNGDATHEARAAKQIMRRHRSEDKIAAKKETATRIVTAARAARPGIICVAHHGSSNTWRAYEPTVPHGEPGVFLDVHHLDNEGTVTKTDREVKVSQRSASALAVTWSRPEWNAWNFTHNRNHYLSNSERKGVIDDLIEHITLRHPQEKVIAVLEGFDPASPETRYLSALTWNAPTAPSDTPATNEDRIAQHDATITRTGGRPTLTVAGRYARSNLADSFRRAYQGHTGEGPVAFKRWTDLRLTARYVDDAFTSEVFAHHARVQAANKEASQERQRRSAEADRYARALHDLVRAEHKKRAHDRFIEDYGTDAEDLWPGHWEALIKGTPEWSIVIHQRDLWGLVKISLEQGEPVVGRTIASLQETAAKHGWRPKEGEWHHHGPITIEEGYETLTVPDPDLAEES